MGPFLKTFYEGNITLIPKSDIVVRGKRNHRTISLMNIDAKILNTTLTY